MAIGAILQIIGAILSIIEMKNRRKYIDRKLELEKTWYEEYNKPRAERNNAILDTTEFEIVALARTIAADLELEKK